MKLTMRLLGILLILVGLSFLIAPEIILNWLESNGNDPLIYIFAIVARLAIGAFFIIAAPESRYPGVIKVLGYLLVLIAIVFVFIGQQSFQDMVSSIVPAIKSYAAIGGLVVIAFSGFLIHAFPGRNGTII